MAQATKLSKLKFQYIESEIFSYFDTLRHIKSLEYEILYSTTNNDDENVGAGNNSVRNKTDTTQQKATALTTDKRLQRMVEKVDAIDKAYNSLHDEKQKVIKLYYWDRPGELTWDGVSNQTNTGRATCIRWRRKFVLDVAEKLGEM